MRRIDVNKVIPILTNREPTESILRRVIFDILIRLSISANLKGFQYLMDGVIMVYRNPDMGKQVVDGLYTELAEKHKTTVSCVERDMRNALSRIKYLADENLVELCFAGKPHTAKRFINNVSSILHSQYDRRKSRIEPM